VFETFKSFAILAQNQFDFDIKKVRSDNGSEFKNARIDGYCDDKAIKHEFSSKYTLEQNGICRRGNLSGRVADCTRPKSYEEEGPKRFARYETSG
jgi:transposase InsO family protein